MSEQSKYLQGCKRRQIIQNWLNGKEDKDWEVFPCKKEGKYILKRRENKTKTPQMKHEQYSGGEEEDVQEQQYDTIEEEEKPEQQDDTTEEEDTLEQEYTQDVEEEDIHEHQDNIQENQEQEPEYDSTHEDPQQQDENEWFLTKYNRDHKKYFDAIKNNSIRMQILKELLQINAFLKEQRKEKELKKLIKQILKDELKALIHEELREYTKTNTTRKEIIKNDPKTRIFADFK